jgi:Nuclease-related domain
MAYDLDRRPGAWVSGQAARRSALVWAFVAALIAVALFSIGLILSGRATILTSVLIIALAVLLKLSGDSAIDAAMPWRWGAKAEWEVGATLNELRYEGYVVMHDIEQRGKGNIDHLVSGSNGVYLVETKSHRFKDGAPRKAKRQAAKLHDELGVWVTPVICISERQRPAFQADGVCVVSRGQLVDWIRNQRNKSVEFDRLARWADTLS